MDESTHVGEPAPVERKAPGDAQAPSPEPSAEVKAPAPSSPPRDAGGPAEATADAATVRVHAEGQVAKAIGADAVASQAEPVEPSPAPTPDAPSRDASAEEQIAAATGGDAIPSEAEPAAPAPARTADSPSRDAQTEQPIAAATGGGAIASEAEKEPSTLHVLSAPAAEAEGAAQAPDVVDTSLPPPAPEPLTMRIVEPEAPGPKPPMPEPVEAEAPLAMPVAPRPEPLQAEASGAAQVQPSSLQIAPSRAPPAAEVAAGPSASLAPPLEAVPAPVSGPQDRPRRPVPAWLPPSLPSRERVGQLLPYLRLAVRGIAAVALGFVVMVLALIVAYRWVDPPLSALMLGQRLAGTPIERQWVPLDRISPHLVKAVILSEDGGFCGHRGVDWRALEDAFESARGGSTISMQVVKNLFLWPSRSYVRKAIEIGLAYLVELIWPKRRILEIYLNIAEWGDGVFGVEAAARHHFFKSASRLTPEEAALLAVSLPNPIERTPANPSAGMRRLAAKLLVRMQISRTSLSCVRAQRPRLAEPAAPFVPGLAGRLPL